MDNFEFCNPTRIVFGKGTEAQVGQEAAAYSKKILLHFGGGSIKSSGLYDRVTASLKAAGVEWVELGGVKPNPRLDLVHEGVKLCKEHQLGLILAVGGGSVIDSAKAIAMGAVIDHDVWDFYMGKGAPVAALPVGTVLTLPAAGSEASTGTVITKEEGWLKRAVNSELIYPRFSILNPELAMTLPPQRMWEGFTALGFGQAPQLGFPGAVAGRVRPHKAWKPIEQATMSYGHGVSVSLVQMARAYTVFARDGELVPLTMLRADGPIAGVPVFRAQTAAAMRTMLEMAAGPKGTAPLAQIPGYRVGGKTGTAHKQENGVYQNKYIASFVGMAPMSNPRIVVAVMVDEPSRGKYYGGQVAAPVFARITGETLRTLRVAPDAPFSTLIVPAEPAKESL